MLTGNCRFCQCIISRIILFSFTCVSILIFFFKCMISVWTGDKQCHNQDLLWLLIHSNQTGLLSQINVFFVMKETILVTFNSKACSSVILLCESGSNKILTCSSWYLPRGNENWKRDLSSVSSISPRQLWDLCETKVRLWLISPEKQVQKISTWAPCKFQRRSHQALNEVSECLPSAGKEQGLSSEVWSLTYCS